VAFCVSSLYGVPMFTAEGIILYLHYIYIPMDLNELEDLPL